MPADMTFDDLVALLQERSSRLTPSQRLLAERVMADPEGVAFMTIGELAGAVGVNESTVVRFATSLGLDGYPGLTRLCRQRLRDQAQLLQRFANLERLVAAPATSAPGDTDTAGDTAVDGDAHDPLARVSVLDQANIARTLAKVDRESWAAAVRALAEAPRVHVVGLRKCHSVAFLLAYLLGLLRDDVTLLDSGAGTLVDELRRVRAGDCFVGISIHRYSRDTVRAFRRARQAGAVTVALTDNPTSPLARDAAHVFYVDTSGVAVLRSVTAFVSLAQALANAVATARGTQTREALALEEELLDEFDVYHRR
jgi:DNA-binding MurR/RpiR family transcriptional regulator